MSTERDDLLAALTVHRSFLRGTLDGLTDDQAGLHPTASELCLGGLVKHVAHVESGWVDFIEQGPSAVANTDYVAWGAYFQWVEGDTIAGALADYDKVAARTDALVLALPDLDIAHPLPEAPWYTPGEIRSARRVFLHIIAETSQHAGHADILRETIDGKKSMG